MQKSEPPTAGRQRGRPLAWLLLLPLVLLLTTPVLGFRADAAIWLEEFTGETEFRQQMEGVVLRLRQRRVETADSVPVAYAGVHPFGANTFFEQEVEEGKLRRSMELLRDAGVRWVRQEIPWDRIEIPAKGQYRSPYGDSWEPYDRLIRLAGEYGLEVVARLDLPPPWAKADTSVPRSPPDNFQDYGDFVASFVERYKGRVRYLQVWNEPNLYLEWGAPPDAARYVELLRIAYTRAKEVDPTVVILSAALAPTLGTPDGLNETDLTYLQKMYDAGAKEYFDILSAQGYSPWTGPGDRRTEESQTNFSRLRLIREVMVRNDDAEKAIWVAEVGWDALPLDFPGTATHGRVTEERQARYTVAAYQRALQEWPWVGVLFYWHFRRVSDEDQRQVDFYYRMVNPDFTLLPVYHAYGAMASAPGVISPGFHQEDHWALNYQGDWKRVEDLQAVLGASVVTHAPGASLAFRFKGTDLALVTAKGLTGGRFFVEIDGSARAANRLPADERGLAYVDLRESEPRWRAEIPLASGLPHGEHQVLLRFDGEGRSGIIDGIIVERMAAFRLRRIAGLALVAGVVFALILALTSFLKRGALG